MLRCIFCGLCEEACPKEAIFLTDRIIDTDYVRQNFIYGKDKLVDPIDKSDRCFCSRNKRNKGVQKLIRSLPIINYTLNL